eukprot:SAG22_NODE_703_length_7779_cov_3.032161_3_plen_275_part_01
MRFPTRLFVQIYTYITFLPVPTFGRGLRCAGHLLPHDGKDCQSRRNDVDQLTAVQGCSLGLELLRRMDAAAQFMAANDPGAAAAAAASADAGQDAGPFVTDPSRFAKTMMPAVRGCVQAANKLPSDAEFEYVASMLPPGKLDQVRTRLCATIESLASVYSMQIGAQAQADTDDAMERMVDMTDHIIEDVDDCMDQLKRINRYAGTQANYTYRDPHARKRPPRRSGGSAMSSVNSDTVADKPQKFFEDKIDNSANTPFVPKHPPPSGGGGGGGGGG